MASNCSKPSSAGLEAELLVGPGAIGTEEDGEVLEQRAASAVESEAVEDVPVDHVAPEPVDETRLIVEPVAEPLQQVVEAPRAAGPVVLRLPDGAVRLPGRVAGERARRAGPGRSRAPDVAEVAREDAVVAVALVAVGEGHAGDRVAAEVPPEPGDVEPGVARRRSRPPRVRWATPSWPNLPVSLAPALGSTMRRV